MAVSDKNRSTSASRCLKHSSRSRAGGCLLFAPWRNSFRYSAVVLASGLRLPLERRDL